MTEQILIQKLKGIVNQYSVFKDTALKLNWIEVREKHFDWCCTYPLGISASLFEFPENYVEKNFKDAFVRCCISLIADTNDWDKNYFDTTAEKRAEYISGFENSNFNCYKNICCWNELRLKPVTANFLQKKIQDFTSKNSIPDNGQNEIISYLNNAVAVDIGGSYQGDHDCIAVHDDCILMISYGIWD